MGDDCNSGNLQQWCFQEQYYILENGFVSFDDSKKLVLLGTFCWFTCPVLIYDDMEKEVFVHTSYAMNIWK